MDVGLVSFVVAAIAADPHFNLTPTEKSWVLSIGFVGMAIGAAFGGYVADRVGRKTVFSATLVIFGLANGGMALSWSLAALLIARLIIGLVWAPSCRSRRRSSPNSRRPSSADV